MSTENLTQTFMIQALKQQRLQHEFAWIAQVSKDDLLHL